MRILVTGAAGFIGSHLSEALLADGHDVVGFDGFDPFYPRLIKERNLTTARASVRFRFVEGDLRDRAAVEAPFADGPFDVVAHVAAKAGVRPSLADPVGYIEANLVGTAHLLEAMRESGTDRLVFASSSSVYGNNEKVPFHEDDNVDRPVSVYAMTKKANEEQLHVHAALYGIRTLCLRLFTVYGPRQRPEMAIHKFTRLLYQGREIPVFGDGSMERDFTYVDDIVAGIVAAVERVGELEFEIVNLGNHSPVRLSELVDRLVETTGKAPRIVHHPVPPGDVRRTWADVERAGRLLGYAPTTSIDEGLRRFVAWYEENGADVEAALEGRRSAAATELE
ncbi:MAG: NAD-dependent epimerase/dehydratase family protein [Gemmatimonadetes bacterium]|nr:NAD-dependent epimerase/dehydratase family protein [Gemmatimonadota bacterium]